MKKIKYILDKAPAVTVLLSGMLMSLCFVYKYLFLLAWVAAVPFGYIMLGRAHKFAFAPFAYMLLFAVGFYGLQYTWFLSMHSLEYMGLTEGQSIFAVILIWLSVTLAQSLQMSVAGLLYGLIKPKGFFAPVVLALLMMVIEWAQGWGDFAMVWGKMALTQYAFLPNVQTVSLFGSLFLGFLIMLVNGLLGLALARGCLGLPARSFALAALSVFVANMFVGTAILAYKDNRPAADTVRMAAVQCNFPSDEKWGTPDSEIWAELMLYSNAAVQEGAQVIIWPESAIVPEIVPGSTYYTQLDSFSRQNNVYIFVGSFTGEVIDGKAVSYNSFIGFAPDGQQYSAYNKRQLVPFGEFIPIGGLLERFEALSALNLKNPLTSGKEGAVFDTEHGKLAPLICFESIFPHYSREAVSNGADILIVGTNDSWFLGSQAVYQHNGHAVLRAVENNKWAVRSANAGQSSIIANDGKVVQSLVPATAGVVVGDVGLTAHKSLYSHIGDIPFLAAAGAVIIYAFMRFRLDYDLTKKLSKKPNRTKAADDKN